MIDPDDWYESILDVVTAGGLVVVLGTAWSLPRARRELQTLLLRDPREMWRILQMTRYLIRLVNGGCIRFIRVDAPERLRGLHPDYVTLVPMRLPMVLSEALVTAVDAIYRHKWKDSRF